jgi:hypothetical protein
MGSLDTVRNRRADRRGFHDVDNFRDDVATSTDDYDGSHSDTLSCTKL